MAILNDFPALSQLSEITSDNQVPEDAQLSCVAASIGMGIQWYRGKTEWDQEINPDHLKDMAVGQGYVGGTAAQAYVPFCESLGFVLYSITDTPENLVQHIHEQVRAGHPVIFTMPDFYVAASLNWSHVCAMYGELGAGLLAMDPYPLPGTNIGHTIHNSDSQWASLLRFNSIWVLIEKEVDVPIVIDLNNTEVANFYSAGPGVGQWTCKVADAKGKHYTIGGEILATYCRWGNAGLCGLSYLGLPLSDEIPLGNGRVKQHFQNGVVAYDPAHTIDNRPGLPGAVYPLNIYGKYGEDPLIAQLEAQIAAMQKQQVPSVPNPYPAAVATIRAALAPLP